VLCGVAGFWGAL